MDQSVKAIVFSLGGKLVDYAFNRITVRGGDPVEDRIAQINKVIESLPADIEELTETSTIAPETANEPPVLSNPMVDSSIDSKKPSETPKEVPTVTATVSPPSNATKAKAIATGCVPCSIGHLATCSGLLNEAMRFAKKDGIASEEVLDRVNMCLDELNALERVDLRSELIVNLPGWQKELANKALTCSRDLRHKLEGLSGVDDLEQVVAIAQTKRNDIGREWYLHRLEMVTPDITIDEAKQMASEEAAKEVEES